MNKKEIEEAVLINSEFADYLDQLYHHYKVGDFVYKAHFTDDIFKKIEYDTFVILKRLTPPDIEILNIETRTKHRVKCYHYFHNKEAAKSYLLHSFGVGRTHFFP